MKLSDILCYGEDFPTTSQELQTITGMTGTQIRQTVHRERLNGLPILSDGAGYYLADSEDEKQRFVRSMRHRAQEILRAANAVSKAKIPGSERGDSEHGRA